MIIQLDILYVSTVNSHPLMLTCFRYLNQQHIKKQKLSEAEIIYGNLSPDVQEQMEIGELGK